MKIEIEIPDNVELDGIANEDMQRMIQKAVCTDHLYEYSGVDTMSFDCLEEKKSQMIL